MKITATGMISDSGKERYMRRSFSNGRGGISPTRSKLFLYSITLLRVTVAALLLTSASVHAGTIIFPPPDEITGCMDYSLPNACTTARFSGGHFAVQGYATNWQWQGCNGQFILGVYFGDTAPATDVSVTLVDQGWSCYDISQCSMRMRVTPSVGNSYYSPQPFVTGQPVTFTASSATGIRMVNFDCSPCYITAVTATQPVKPTVKLSIGRNGDATYSAIVNYTFPSQSAQSDRTLSLALLPSGQEPGTTYPTQTDLPLTGTFIQSLGTFDTDRTLRAIATSAVCEGLAEAEATVSGCSQCKGPAKAIGDPIRLFDGVMTYAETDPLPATIGPEFRREYTSGAAADGRFGTGWSSVFDASAVSTDADNNKSVAVVNEDRTRSIFRQIVPGDWTQTWPVGGTAGTLTGSESTGYTFRDAGRSIVRTFGTNHRLTRLQDLRRGMAVSVTYDGSGNPARIFDESGNWSCTVTTANSHVVGIAVDGRPDLAWTYVYNGSLLTSVSVAGAASPWRTYDYTSGRLSAIHDATGAIIERHDYDAAGRATSSYGPSGDVTSIQYAASDANGIAATTATRADNSQQSYQQAFAAGEVVTQRADGGCSSCGTNDATAAYDSSGNLTRLQNARGYVTVSTYDVTGRHLIGTTTAEKPSGCNPETDPAHCRLSSASLATTALDRTAASQDMTFTYADPNWPAKPTRITRNSVLWSGLSTETFTFDPATGEMLVHSISGAIDGAGTQEVHTTGTLLYNGTEAAAFSPGGAFQSSWLTLAQPAGLKKSIDGPRTDVADVTAYVYYPLDNSVPGPWRGRLAATRDALGHISRFQDYNAFGAAETTVDANGVVTRFTFDAMGRGLTSTIAAVPGCDTTADPLCATDLTTTRTYSSTSGALASEQRPGGNVTTYEYDSRGRLQRMSRGTASTPLERIEYTYDPTTGKKSSETANAFENNAWAVKKSETYTYTSDGNLSSVVHADNTRQLFAYLSDGTLGSVQDENHAAPNTFYAYDSANRLSSVTQTLAGAPGGQIVTRYSYDIQGNLTSVTDPNGNVTTYVYDDFGRMQRQTSPVSGVTTYTYDAAGNVLSTTDANGAMVTRTYDALNRVVSSVSPRPSSTETVSWTYDDTTAGSFGIGRAATMTDPTGSTIYRYERRGLLQSEAKTIAGSTYPTSFAYDANGNRSAMNYPNGIAAHYTFDFADRPYSLTNGATSIVSSAAYLPFGPMTSVAFGNGTTRTMRYDTRYRPLENKLTGPGGTIADYNYAEDNNGNITQIHDAVSATYNRDYGYDDLNRLTIANSGTALWGSGSYAYDAMGNMVSSSLGTWKTTSSSLVGITPKLTTVVENGVTRAVSYDSVGNEIGVGSSAFAYSPRNALASADASSYVYDGRGVLSIATISVVSLAVSPSNVTGGSVATGTVTLSTPAVAETVITLTSSNPPAVGVPSSVVIASGGTTASFTVTTWAVVATVGATITATFNQYTATAPIYVVPAEIASVTLSPSTIVGGDAVTGTITLTGTAATSLTVSLSSNNTAASVPSSVTIAAGSGSATFPVTTTSGVSGTTAVISATLNATTRQASLVFVDAELNGLSIAPTAVLNGGSATGTVTLTGRANAPLSITLSRSSADVSWGISTVTVPAGASSATFMLQGSLRTAASRTVTITATHGAATRQATLTVNLPWLSNLTASPQTLIGGNNTTATATINGPPPTDLSYNVTFTSTNTSLVRTPDGVNYFGTMSGQSTVFTNPVLSGTPVVMTAHDPTGATLSQTLTLQPAPVTLSTLALSPASIVGLNKVTGTVTLTAAAPAPGIDVDIKTTAGEDWHPPPFVHVPTGSTSATFVIDTGMPLATSTSTISAIHSATTKTAVMTVQPATATPYLTHVQTQDPNLPYVIGGTSVPGLVGLSTWATGGGITVNLASSNTAALTVPSSVKVTKNNSTQSFTITTKSITAPVDVVITATATGTVVSYHVLVLPPNGVTLHNFYGVELWPSSYASGSAAGRVLNIGTVSLTGPAPAGGVTVGISGSRPNIITLVDASGTPTGTITIPAGATWANIYAVVYPFTGIDHGTIISATLGSVTKSSPEPYLTITAMQQAYLARTATAQCASLALAPCLSSIAAVQPSPRAVGDTTGYDLYTPELRLLAETEITAASTKSIAYSYLWFGDLPVASIEAATNMTRWYATDHLGTPLVMTDAGGVVIWRAEYAPYGAVFSLRTGGSLHQPLRFPGQIAQDGTETYYNVFRHYRSSWGRYTSSDPIGLSGSLNVYSYAADAPTVGSDPLGLLRWRYYTQHTTGTSTMRDGCTEARFRLNHACRGACDLRSRKEFWKLEYEAEAEFFIFISRGGQKTLEHEEEHVALAVSNITSSLATLLSYEKPQYRSRSECETSAAQGVRMLNVNAERGQAGVDDYYGYLIGQLFTGGCR